MIDKFYGQYTPMCDNCEDTLPGELSHNDAREAMKNAGWHTEKSGGDWTNYCPECWYQITHDGNEVT